MINTKCIKSKIFDLILFLLLAYTSLSFVNSSPTDAGDAQAQKKDLSNFIEFTKQNLNDSVNPCEDFYSYACGNWKNNKMIPEEIRKWSATKFAEFKFDQLIEEFLKSSSDTSSPAEGKAKKFYSSCLAQSKQIENSMNVVINYIESKIPTDLCHKQIDWIDINFMFKEFDVQPFIKIDLFQYKNSSKNEISIKFQQQNWFTTFVILMQSVSSENMDQGARIFRHLPQLTAFHRNLSSIIDNNVEQTHRRIINWTRVLNEEFPEGIDNQWTINNDVKNKEEFLDLLENTNKEILIYYAAMKLASDYVDMFKSEVYLPAKKSCLHYTKKYFLSAMTPWLIKNAPYIEMWQSDAFKIADHFKFAFEERANRLTLFEETNKNGQKKLNATAGMIGFTEETKDSTYQDKSFESIEISEDFWQNLFNLKRKEIKDAKSSSIPKLAFQHASFFPRKNLFSIPLQYTQMPFYNENFTDLMKYGGLGFLIGYEIAKGFDYDNFIYNADGKHEKWWTEDAYNYYAERYLCFITHLANVKFNGKKLANGFSKSEVVANVLGMKFAYDAFLKELENTNVDSNEKPIENFDFTRKQMHFLQFAQTQCYGVELYNFAKFLNNEFHAVEPFRVNGLLQNLPEFGEAYQCPLGSYMNPEVKCILWGEGD